MEYLPGNVHAMERSSRLYLCSQTQEFSICHVILTLLEMQRKDFCKIQWERNSTGHTCLLSYIRMLIYVNPVPNTDCDQSRIASYNYFRDQDHSKFFQ